MAMQTHPLPAETADAAGGVAAEASALRVLADILATMARHMLQNGAGDGQAPAKVLCLWLERMTDRQTDWASQGHGPDAACHAAARLVLRLDEPPQRLLRVGSAGMTGAGSSALLRGAVAAAPQSLAVLADLLDMLCRDAQLRAALDAHGARAAVLLDALALREAENADLLRQIEILAARGQAEIDRLTCDLDAAHEALRYAHVAGDALRASG